MSRALVTGAAGLVGANLVRVLLDDGAQEVRAFVRATTDTRALDGLDVELAHGDVRDAAALARAVAGCDVVYHCAAVYRIVGGDAHEIVDTAVSGTRNALDAVASVPGVQRIVLTSSVVAVGRAPSPDQPIDENSPWNIENPYPYIVAKRRSEEEALRLARERDLPLVVVNPTGIVGEWDTKPTPSADVILTLVNAPIPVPFYPLGGGNTVDAGDVATGHLLAARKGRIGERYILAGDNATFREILSVVADLAGATRPFLPLGPTAAWGAGALMELAARFTRKPPDLTRELARHHVGLWQYVSTAKAERELGFTHRPLREVIERSLRWLARDGRIKRPERLRLSF